MIKAVLFDCWGTLFHDEITMDSFDNIAKKIGRSMKDRSFLKLFEKNLMLEKYEDAETPVRNLLEELKIECYEELVKELSEILTEKSLKYIKPFPETFEVLKLLRKKARLTIITNTDCFGFEFLEKKYNLRKLFDVIITSYETGLLKPDRRMFELALEKLKVKPEEALYVGDDPINDIKAASAAGIKGILIDRKGKYSGINVIKNLKELEIILEKQ